MNMKRLMPGQQGFSLGMVLIVAAVLGVGSLALSTLIVNARRQAAVVETRATIENIRGSLKLVLASSASCSCQLDPEKNTASASGLVVNTTDPTPADIDMAEFRLGCDFASADKTFLKVNTAVPNFQPTVIPTRIQVRGLKSVGAPVYTGTLAISFRDPNDTQTFLLNLPLQLAVDPTAGTPSARPTDSCAMASGGIATCPSGWVMVGSPGVLGTFCVQETRRAAATQFNAVTTCGQLIPAGYGRARLCDYASLFAACSIAGVSNITAGSGEWANMYFAPSGNLIGLIGGVGSCSGFSFTSLSSSLPFRCCL